jgi:glutathione S-transferase
VHSRAAAATFPGVEFYYGRLSGNSARTAFALHEAGVHYSGRLVYTPKGENRSPAYVAINPTGKVPSLTDGELRLWESNAINWYVAEKHPETRLLPPTLAGRASVQRWLMFQAGHVSPASTTIFRKTNARVRDFWKTDADPKAVEAAYKELGRYLTVLEQALSGRDWLEGEFSLADIAYAPHFAAVVEGEEKKDGLGLSATPNVAAWLQRMWARPAWKKATEMAFSGTSRDASKG